MVGRQWPQHRYDHAGKTGWQTTLTNTGSYLWVDVPTSGSKFRGTPRYFASLVLGDGSSKTYRCQGTHIIAHPKKTGFRQYVMYAGDINGKLAEASNWTVSWIGVPKSDPRSNTVGDTDNWLVESLVRACRG